jgi:hypothetical protein
MKQLCFQRSHNSLGILVKFGHGGQTKDVDRYEADGFDEGCSILLFKKMNDSAKIHNVFIVIYPVRCFAM